MATLGLHSAPATLARFFADAREAIDADLERRLRPIGDDPGRLREAMWYAATGPGKRLRPAIVLAAAEACGGDRARALPAASALEMLHAYTLVHDDLPAMDDDDERRGRPTVHVVFGEAIAILAGDGLLTAAFGALGELGAGAGDACTVLARRAGGAELLAGQAMDLRGDLARASVSLADIERVHAAKTGALFAAAGELGAIAAGAPAAARSALAHYGLAIGIAFQHADDRDDAELADHASAAAARMRELCDDARAAASTLGPRGAMLDAIAAWIGSRA
jgi:geranylgeranyl pyrophosphate synthase|nr:polyprenyl synthetase family protein [Kofleriaceae bacterium]